jgi:hypothetical protein
MTRDAENLNRIPVRLPDDRRAYLFLPERFLSTDREWLKRAIDNYLADDEGYIDPKVLENLAVLAPEISNGKGGVK